MRSAAYLLFGVASALLGFSVLVAQERGELVLCALAAAFLPFSGYLCYRSLLLPRDPGPGRLPVK
jgi:hypothetical protein